MRLLQELRNAFNQKSVVRNILFCLAVVIILHLFYSTYREGMNVRELKKIWNDNKTELIEKHNKHKSFEKFKKTFKNKVRRNVEKCKKKLKKGEDKSTCKRLTVGKKYIKDTYPELYDDVVDITPNNRISPSNNRIPPSDNDCENATKKQVEWKIVPNQIELTVNLNLGDCVEFTTYGEETFQDLPIVIKGLTGKEWVNVNNKINNFTVKPPTVGTYHFECTESSKQMSGTLIVS